MARRSKKNVLSKGIPDEDRVGLYDPSFMDNLRPEKGTKVAVNAGASDTELLAKLVAKTIKKEDLNLKVAWIEGDEVMDVVQELMEQGEKFENICFGGNLKDWGFEPIAA
ncbi:hypothetical protein LTR04_005518, partial [Oleoguttula sp. CCFEE 6159]